MFPGYIRPSDPTCECPEWDRAAPFRTPRSHSCRAAAESTHGGVRDAGELKDEVPHFGCADCGTRGRGIGAQQHRAAARIIRETSMAAPNGGGVQRYDRSEEHTSELQSRFDLVCRLLL